MQFIGMLQDAGYTDKQICDVFDSFCFYTYQRSEQPENLIHYIDVLIDLYEHEKGTGWKEDKVFFQILWQIKNAFWYGAEIKHEGLEFSDIWTFSNSVIGQVDQNSYP